MVVLFICQAIFAHVFLKKSKYIKACLAKRLVCFNMFGAMSLIIFQIVFLIGLLYDASNLRYVGTIGSLISNFANFFNYWYLIRMKRVQVQLKAKAEEASLIISEINNSVRIQRLAIIVSGVTLVLYAYSLIGKA